MIEGEGPGAEEEEWETSRQAHAGTNSIYRETQVLHRVLWPPASLGSLFFLPSL